MTGGPIFERRLVGHADGMVTFTARKGTTTGGSDDTEDVVIPGVEFVRRWALHILPKGYTKTRRYGGHCNCHAKRYIAECQGLLSIREPANMILREPRCPKCESPMSRTRATDRPGWRTVMSSAHRPNWYDDG